MHCIGTVPRSGNARYLDVTNSGHSSRPCVSSVKQRSLPFRISHCAPRRSTTASGSHVPFGGTTGPRGVRLEDGDGVGVAMSGGHSSSPGFPAA